jgi:hypothetical protein
MGGQRLDGALGQHRAETERQAGGLDHLEDRDLQRLGQTLPAEVRIRRQAVPAALGELAIGVGEAGRGGHPAVGVLRADPVPRPDSAAR